MISMSNVVLKFLVYEMETGNFRFMLRKLKKFTVYKMEAKFTVYVIYIWRIMDL